MKLTFPVFWLIEYQPDSSSLKYGHPNRGLLAVYWQNVRFSIIISTRIFDINVVPEHLSSAKWFIILDPAKDPNYEPVSLQIPSGTWRFSYLDEMSLCAIKGRGNQTLHFQKQREPVSPSLKAGGNRLSLPSMAGGTLRNNQKARYSERHMVSYSTSLLDFIALYPTYFVFLLHRYPNICHR